MEKIRLNQLPLSLKWAITAFLFLTSLAFGVAVWQSFERYELNHEKTSQYYLGDPAEGESAIPKPLGHLVSVTHVHSFTMPLVFLAVWIGLQGTPLASRWKVVICLGGFLSILTYNTAPYVVRYYSAHSAFLFTVGGIGLFLFFFWPAGAILYETWRGFKD